MQPPTDGVYRVKVYLSNGLRTIYELKYPRTPETPIAIFLTGNSGHVSDPFTHHLRKFFLDRGFGWFCYDHLGRGASMDITEGIPMTEILLSQLAQQAKEMVQNVLWPKLQEKFKTKGQKFPIFFGGTSLGGNVASLALRDQIFQGYFDIKGVALFVPSTDRRNVIIEKFLTATQRDLLMEPNGVLDFEYTPGGFVKLTHRYVKDCLESSGFCGKWDKGLLDIDFPFRILAGGKDEIAPVY
jgi:pimeloyl-ACP methyl ester carboxylesterase